MFSLQRAADPKGIGYYASVFSRVKSISAKDSSTVDEPVTFGYIGTHIPATAPCSVSNFDAENLVSRRKSSTTTGTRSRIAYPA